MPVREQLTAPALMVASGTSLYLGAAIAVGLFGTFPPVVVAWMRIAGAALILVAINRPRARDFIGPGARAAVIYGVVTMAMNMTFYEAIARIPMGTAVAIEFLGPIAVAAFGSRSVRDWLALLLAGSGVLVISGATWSSDAGGIMFALAAGGLWAAYIVAGSRIAGDAATSRASTAVGFTWAAIIGLPFMFFLWPNDGDSNLLVTTAMVLSLGLLSAAIPYSIDQVVLRRAGNAYFAVLQAILPVVAAIIGAITLAQWLSPPELIGVALIVVAVALRRPA